MRSPCLPRLPGGSDSTTVLSRLSGSLEITSARDANLPLETDSAPLHVLADRELGGDVSGTGPRYDCKKDSA